MSQRWMTTKEPTRIKLDRRGKPIPVHRQSLFERNKYRPGDHKHPGHKKRQVKDDA